MKSKSLGIAITWNEVLVGKRARPVHSPGKLDASGTQAPAASSATAPASELLPVRDPARQIRALEAPQESP